MTVVRILLGIGVMLIGLAMCWEGALTKMEWRLLSNARLALRLLLFFSGALVFLAGWNETFRLF